MGKKSRRRDETKKGHSAAVKSQKEVVSNIEAEDPSYLNFQKLPRELSRLVVKHRFGGTADGLSSVHRRGRWNTVCEDDHDQENRRRVHW